MKGSVGEPTLRGVIALDISLVEGELDNCLRLYLVITLPPENETTSGHSFVFMNDLGNSVARHCPCEKREKKRKTRRHIHEDTLALTCLRTAWSISNFVL